MPAKPRPTTRRHPAAPARRAPSSLVPRLVLGALVAAAIVTGVSVVASRGGDDDVAAPSIAHVHGLGLNPADGSLQVATHTGTFRIGDDGRVRRVGSTAQDTMGFTVVGPNRFLGSGHPDAAGFRQGKPARLGLIESTDAGATWTNRSLSGEVDFHALAASQGTTYGWDAGTGPGRRLVGPRRHAVGRRPDRPGPPEPRCWRHLAGPRRRRRPARGPAGQRRRPRRGGRRVG